MSIKPLPGDVAVQIKSSVTITSLNGVVLGLLQNSLDADASKINVSVDYSRGNCAVEDDGLGIPPRDFRSDGGLGQLHHTSRYPPRADRHGRNGEFLASLATLSLLSITSHHYEYNSHNSLTIHNSRILARDIPAQPEQRVLAFSTGTRVAVRDLFGSMPVRVKERAAEFERAGSAKEFDQLVRTVVALLLAWPGPASLSLRESTSNKSVNLRTTTAKKTHNGGSTVARTPALLAQAGLCDGGQLVSWVPVGASAPGVSIAGCISLIPVATKQAQFLSLGIQPLLNEHQCNVLYGEVNRVFSQSSFGVIEEESSRDEAGDLTKVAFTRKEMTLRKGIDRWPMFYICITLADEAAASDSSGADVLFDGQQQTLAVIIDLLRIAAYEFLKKHHFRPKAVNAFQFLRPDCSDVPSREGTRESMRRPTPVSRRPSGRSASSRAQTPGSRPQSPFAGWLNVKSGGPAMLKKAVEDPSGAGRDSNMNNVNLRNDAAPAPVASSTKRPRLIDPSGKLMRRPFDTGDSQSTELNPLARPETKQVEKPSEADGNEPRETTTWTDPVTKNTCLVDLRTGFVLKSTSVMPLVLPSKTPLADQKEDVPKCKSPWVEDILEKWTNPVFETTELPIPHLPDIFDDARPASASNLTGRGCVVSHEGHGAVPSISLEGRISRDALRQARVIGQVDRKFILAAIPNETRGDTVSGHFATNNNDKDLSDSEGKDVLVLIDQHAADERCQVEDLMRDYFAAADEPAQAIFRFRARTERPDRPLRFELSAKEGELLARFSRHFEHWGVFYDAFSPESNTEQQQQQQQQQQNGPTTAKVEVQSLPPSILERCRLEPRLLADLLRREAWKLHDNPSLATKGEARGTDVEGDESHHNHEWVRRFHGCPQGILDLLNSRSCRSAIMFNDMLSVGECAGLLRRLTECAFPFQCAHGRPSMAPLVDLGDGDGGIGTGRVPGESGDNGQLWRGLQAWGKRKRGKQTSRQKKGEGKEKGKSVVVGK